MMKFLVVPFLAISAYGYAALAFGGDSSGGGMDVGRIELVCGNELKVSMIDFRTSAPKQLDAWIAQNQQPAVYGWVNVASLGNELRSIQVANPYCSVVIVESDPKTWVMKRSCEGAPITSTPCIRK